MEALTYLVLIVGFIAGVATKSIEVILLSVILMVVAASYSESHSGRKRP